MLVGVAAAELDWLSIMAPSVVIRYSLVYCFTLVCPTELGSLTEICAAFTEPRPLIYFLLSGGDFGLFVLTGYISSIRTYIILVAFSSPCHMTNARFCFHRFL